MRLHRISLCALASLAAFALPGLAQDNAAQANPWNGSWKLDRSSLKYDGPTYTVAQDAEGYTITRGGKASPKVICNGQPNAPYEGTVTTCTKTATGYDLVNTRDGKQVSTVKIDGSPDGSTVTHAATVTPPDGSAPFTITTVNKRVSQTNTAAGDPVTYKEESFTESQDTGILTVQVNGDSVDFKETDNDKPVTAKLDGTPVAFGRRSVSIKLADPHTLKVTYSNNGKVDRENTFVLSQDGQSIEETDITPEPNASTMTVTLHKS